MSVLLQRLCPRVTFAILSLPHKRIESRLLPPSLSVSSLTHNAMQGHDAVAYYNSVQAIV